MKRNDLERLLRSIAREAGRELSIREGRGDHSKALIDEKFVTSIPRHKEINEYTAKKIIKMVREAVK